jgi:hypothetical protein
MKMVICKFTNKCGIILLDQPYDANSSPNKKWGRAVQCPLILMVLFQVTSWEKNLFYIQGSTHTITNCQIYHRQVENVRVLQ